MTDNYKNADRQTDNTYIIKSVSTSKRHRQTRSSQYSASQLGAKKIRLTDQRS